VLIAEVGFPPLTNKKKYTFVISAEPVATERDNLRATSSPM
jgi:hypothetical protein